MTLIVLPERMPCPQYSDLNPHQYIYKGLPNQTLQRFHRQISLIYPKNGQIQHQNYQQIPFTLLNNLFYQLVTLQIFISSQHIQIIFERHLTGRVFSTIEFRALCICSASPLSLSLIYFVIISRHILQYFLASW